MDTPKQEILDSIKELKPERRLNILFPLSAALTLSAVVWFLFKVISNDNTSYIKELKENCQKQVDKDDREIATLRHEKDSLINLGIIRQTETINKLNSIIEKQEKQKNLFK